MAANAIQAGRIKGQASTAAKAGDHIAVWFSCGAASAVAAKKTLELYPDCMISVLNNYIAEEHEDNRRFLNDVADWLGVNIEDVRSKKYPNQSCVEVWEDRKYMSGVAGAPCTGELKKKARQEWEAENKPDWTVLGFTVEEKGRHARFVMNERDTVIPVLIDLNISKAECYQIISEAGIKLPEIYRLGYPNANCIGCVKAQSPTYWNHVRKVHPEIFEQRAEQSRRLGARLVRVGGERLFLDELSEHAYGAPMKDMDFECGLFCEERE